ncbi:FeoC-like transcriptional regulator [Legionella dresdenensis]|uniref:FeoC-like transcriptional regulator n=1 Tax=Legionella dresdenensis TaxID=450200 RepID=A0ABV8CF66_9GAMM
MLYRIRDYLVREKVASNQQLARELAIDIQTLQPMLDLWMRKGVIAKCDEKNSCRSSCFKCAALPPVFYRIISPA